MASDEDSKPVELPEELVKLFDQIFHRYVQPLSSGAIVRFFIKDTQTHRDLMEMFVSRYLPQRAEYEGWEYVPANLQIVYSNALPQQEGVLVDPRGRNVGITALGGRPSFIPYSEARRVRDDLAKILEGSG